MFLPLDGPGSYSAISVTDTPVEVKVGVVRKEQRAIITIQPLDGHVWFGYDNSVDESSGTKIFKGQYFPLEAGDKLAVWIVASTGETVDVRITEVG